MNNIKKLIWNVVLKYMWVVKMLERVKNNVIIQDTYNEATMES